MATYALGDLHGHLEIYYKVKELLKPEDKVYFLGDAGDRGPQSWECIKTIYKDPQFIYIKGNHEDMLVKACQDYLADDFMWNYPSYSLCRMNGGEQTMLSWECEQFGREEWIHKLDELPTWDAYENPDGKVFVLCHAGFTPWLKKGTQDECVIPADRKLIWDREHYYQKWNEERMDDVIIVHGHTPIHHLSEDLWMDWESGAFWYCDGHKVCIDSGGFFSDEFILLNLDTLEDTVIKLDKKA